MSTLFESWQQCLRNKGFPVPSVEDAHEALELMDKPKQAIENPGGEVEITIGAQIAASAGEWRPEERNRLVQSFTSEAIVPRNVGPIRTRPRTTSLNPLFSMNSLNSPLLFFKTKLQIPATGCCIAN